MINEFYSDKIDMRALEVLEMSFESEFVSHVVYNKEACLGKDMSSQDIRKRT